MENRKQKIIPHLWFDNQAEEAARFYVSAFENDSKIIGVQTLLDTPSGDSNVVSFELAGHMFLAISAGPLFEFNPSVSFIINFDPSKDTNARQNLDALWEKLSEDGKALMPLDTYPFSERYGWVQDKYGVSWQLILTNPEGEERPFIVPSFLFVGSVCGKAEEAMDFYLSTFEDSRQGLVVRYGEDQEPDEEGTIMFADFMIGGAWFAAMDSAHEHNFAFNEAISFMVYCDNQEEIDYYWSELSAVPEAEQCGWLKDPYGISWQVVPGALDKMMSNGTPEQIERLTKAFPEIKKFNIRQLKEIYEGGHS